MTKICFKGCELDGVNGCGRPRASVPEPTNDLRFAWDLRARLSPSLSLIVLCALVRRVVWEETAAAAMVAEALSKLRRGGGGGHIVDLCPNFCPRLSSAQEFFVQVVR